METREYHTMTAEKKTWGEGAWNDEPDKMQYEDPDTGYPTLIVRGPSGALCGYVGVDEGHPWYQKDYDNAEVDVWVHGGLTFSSLCNPKEVEEEGICHVPGPGEPDHVWWLGFDCAHGGDLSPKMAYEMESSGINAKVEEHMRAMYGDEYVRKYVPHWKTDKYRDIAYVMKECADLAEQIEKNDPRLSPRLRKQTREKISV